MCFLLFVQVYVVFLHTVCMYAYFLCVVHPRARSRLGRSAKPTLKAIHAHAKGLKLGPSDTLFYNASTRNALNRVGLWRLIKAVVKRTSKDIHKDKDTSEGAMLHVRRNCRNRDVVKETVLKFPGAFEEAHERLQEDEGLIAIHRPESVVLRAERGGVEVDRHAAELDGVQRRHRATERDEDERRREEQPVDKIDAPREGVVRLAGEDAVGARADQRRDAAARRAVRDREERRRREALDVAVLGGCARGGGGGVEDAGGEGHEHHGGGDVDYNSLNSKLQLSNFSSKHYCIAGLASLA